MSALTAAPATILLADAAETLRAAADQIASAPPADRDEAARIVAAFTGPGSILDGAVRIMRALAGNIGQVPGVGPDAAAYVTRDLGNAVKDVEGAAEMWLRGPKFFLTNFDEEGSR